VPFGGAAEAQVALRNALDHWVELHGAQLHSR